jgi:hypothetical protein
MADGLPIPRNRPVLTEAPPMISGNAGSAASAWQSIAQSGERIMNESASYLEKEMHAAKVASIADFEMRHRTEFTQARDKFANDPDGFKKWSDAHVAGAIESVPSNQLPHVKQFLSRETDSNYGSILSERRSRDKALDTQTITARTKMADDDVMSLASNGLLNTPEGQTAVATYKGVLDSAVSSGLMAPEHAQLMTEQLTTRAQGTIFRNQTEQVYREKGFEAAREHLNKTLDEFGGPYRVKDEIRQKTLAWLRSEESGLKGERDAIGREWAEAKKNIAVLDPAVLQDIQNRAYERGAFKVGDDIQAHSSALQMVKTIRQLPQHDQVRILATGDFNSRLTQRESGGDPTKMNTLGYVGRQQFGAPRLQTLGVYTPGSGENMAAWSRTPRDTTGKWSGSFNIPGFPNVKTVEDFRNNPEAQTAVEGMHRQKTEQEIDALGLNQYEGQTIAGVPITRDGLRAMVHIGGAEGARRVLASGGQYNPADAYGTTVMDYARLGTNLTGSRSGLIALNMVKKDLGQDLTKKISDFSTAIGKTEYPPVEDLYELGVQVALLGTEEQKRQVAEMNAQAEFGRKFVTMPQAQREEIVQAWKEKLKKGIPAYERRLADTVITADKQVTEEWKKDPYGAASRYSEGIPALPTLDFTSPTAPQQLGARVAVQNTIRADQGMGAFSALRGGEAQQLAQTLVSGDPRQGSQIINMMAQNLPPEMYRATIADAPIKAALDGMVRSYDPERLNTAFSVMDRAYRDDPLGFKSAFGDDTLRRLQTWQARKDSMSPIQMAEHFKRADDPSFAAARKKLEDEADTKMSGMTPAKVANELGSTADRWVPFVNQAAPQDPLAANAMAAEYTRLFKERYADTGDVDKAKAQTVERLKTVWGPSTAAGGALMKHPPERYYPQVDGSHDWMKKELDDAIIASRGGEPGAPGRDPLLFGKPYSYKLISDARTEADVSSKRPPSYVVVVTDKASGRDTIPLDMQGNPTRFSFNPKSAQETAREAFTTDRENLFRLRGGDLALPVP